MSSAKKVDLLPLSICNQLFRVDQKSDRLIASEVKLRSIAAWVRARTALLG